jgi:hypothetical protein
MVLTPGVGLSLPELMQEQCRQIRQQAILWRAVAVEMRGESLTFPLCCFDQISCWYPRNTP